MNAHALLRWYSAPGLALVVLLLVAAVGVARAPAARLQPAYTFTDLGTLDGRESEAHAINAAGQAVGVCRHGLGTPCRPLAGWQGDRPGHAWRGTERGARYQCSGPGGRRVVDGGRRGGSDACLPVAGRYDG
jgi:hypothetical protein